jgi:hypothetical protein
MSGKAPDAPKRRSNAKGINILQSMDNFLRPIFMRATPDLDVQQIFGNSVNIKSNERSLDYMQSAFANFFAKKYDNGFFKLYVDDKENVDLQKSLRRYLDIVSDDAEVFIRMVIDLHTMKISFFHRKYTAEWLKYSKERSRCISLPASQTQQCCFCGLHMI